MDADVLIIGAGFAGLMAARELSAAGKKVMVLEARSHAGGRAHTVTSPFSGPVETGAEFIHGQLKLSLQLMKSAGLTYSKATGEIWNNEEGHWHQQADFIEHFNLLMKALKKQKEDLPVYDFIEANFSGEKFGSFRKSIYRYTEGYYAADIHTASTLYLKEEMQGPDDDDLRPDGGYAPLVNYLLQDCLQKGCRFFFSTEVATIRWEKEKVEAAATNGALFTVPKVLVTVPLGVLQAIGTESARLNFKPALPHKINAARQLGFGAVIKIALQFSKPFWLQDGRLKDTIFIFSDQPVPTWWTQHPQTSALLTGWCAGPAADKLKHQTREQLFQIALFSLAQLFKMSIDELRSLVTAWDIYNWATDPLTQGGYTFVTTNTKKALAVLTQPEEDTIYFAGEALHDGIEVGTVEAALQNGQKAAMALLK